MGQWMRASSSMSLDTSSTDMCFCSASSRPCTSCMPCGKGACVSTHVHGDRRREEVTQSKCLHSTPTLMAHLALTPPSWLTPPSPHPHPTPTSTPAATVSILSRGRSRNCSRRSPSMKPAAGLLRCSLAKERQLSTHVKGVHTQ